MSVLGSTGSLIRASLIVLCAFVSLTAISPFASAQTSATDGKTPTGLTPGAPAGSYALGGFDNVNLFNGNLNFALPLKNVSGRGSASYPITLPIEQRWRTVSGVFDLGGGSFIYYSTPEPNWWTGLEPGYSPGVVQARSVADGPMGGCAGSEWYTTSMTRLTFSGPDGTELELKDRDYDGRPLVSSLCYAPTPTRGTIFTSSDGSATTFVSDFSINDDHFATGPLIYGVTGYLKFANGVVYRVVQGLVTSIRDPNGNTLTFTYGTNPTDPLTYQRVLEIKDSLNRLVTVSYGDNVTVFYDTLTFKGFNGANRTLRVWHSTLGNALRTTQPGDSTVTQSGQQLFPEISTDPQSYNPLVVSSLELPNGQHYDFRYNKYGELARIILPTGGAIEYDYTATSGVVCQGLCAGGAQIYRRVIERRIYADGTTLEGKTRFTATSVAPNSTVQVDALTPSDVLLARSKHYFHGDAAPSLFLPSLYLAPWTEGKEYQTDQIKQDGTTVLRRTAHTWQQRAPVSWWPLGWQGTSQNDAPVNDPRVRETVTTLVDTNQVSKQTFDYDDSVPYNNKNSVKEYELGSGAAGVLRRETRTTYVTTTTYTGTNVNLRRLPSQISIFDGGGVERGRTTYEYDNYNPDANHAGLVNRTSISALDPAFTTSYLTRGNATRSTRHLFDTGGLVTGSVASHQQYDIAGNVVKAIDALGYATIFEFPDRFGSPDGEAQSNAAPSGLSGLTSYAFPTKVINAANHTAYSQFDYSLGQPVDTEDSNGVINSLHYNDALDRPTQVKLATGTSSASQTSFTYDETNRTITSTSDLHILGDNVLTNKTLYDGLGRTTQTRQYEGGSNYIVKQTQYDAFGRAFKTSNPFRPWQSETAVWTTQAFDGLGRVISVTTPDNAVVSTTYSGNSATVTDPAGKARKSVTDALGRLIEAYEDPGSANHQTTYGYDVLDNLVKVTQGSQQRSFMYDSLKRLIRVRNLEQGTLASLNLSDPLTGNSTWSIGYQYDSNGNLTQKTDARGVVATYVYDVLNRNSTIDYSDTASINPDVKRFYDGAIKGKGRFWYNYTGGDISAGSNVDHSSIDSYDELGRPLVQRQLFKLNGTWSATYQTSRIYNRAGSVASQTYPSGHSVTYNYDNAGRMGDKDVSNLAFTGNLGDGVLRTYASGNIYSQWGSLTMEKFGTQTPLYHKLQYNIRGQLWDVRVATGSDVNGSWNRGALQFFYESTYTHGASGPGNNGNVLKTNHYVPLDESSSTWAIHDHFYGYDSLNRLTSVAEYFISSTQPISQQSLQTFTYDRWGNRNLNAGQTWGTGINNRVFTIDTTTNRLGVPGGQPGVMSYDNAGNLTTDSYTGVGARTYDAENRMITAADNTGQISRYTYNVDGQRTRRQVAGSQEEWQIYGFDGELVAEYRASSPASSPEREYGYRNGILLISASGRFNVALSANGAVATASTAHTCCGFSTTGAINGNYRGPWGNGEGWNDATESVVPDWIQVAFAGDKTIDEISVFSLHDNYTQENTPTETQTFSLYGLLAFDVQYWNGSTWVTIPSGSVTGNNKVWRKFTFSPITTSKIRVFINTVPDAWSRVVEIQAFGTSATGEKVQWLVPDHLGTPRIVVDLTGNRVNVKRHDYLPFGEELFAGSGGRTPALGYIGGDGVRQQFTQYERDIETGLDYAQARYYGNTQGRFLSVDPLLTSGRAAEPASWNRYAYANNNPLRFTDPTGLVPNDYYAAADGTIRIYETPDAYDRFFVESAANGPYNQVAQLNRNAEGLVEFPGNGPGFNRYGVVDAGGVSGTEVVGAGDHFVQPEVASALFGMVHVLNGTHNLTMSFGDMSSSNGSDPWQRGGFHHGGHGHDGNRTGRDIDFRYLDGAGQSFQAPDATTNAQFSQGNNQTVYNVANTFGFSVNYHGTAGPAMQNASRAGGHNDHGHLGFGDRPANVMRFRVTHTLPNGTPVYGRVP